MSKKIKIKGLKTNQQPKRVVKEQVEPEMTSSGKKLNVDFKIAIQPETKEIMLIDDSDPLNPKGISTGVFYNK